jgi:hypothetical protein
MAFRIGNQTHRNVTRIGSMILLCLLLASCSLGGDDTNNAEDPTATSASQVDAQSEATKEEPELSEPTESASPESPFTLIPPSPEASAAARATETVKAAVGDEGSGSPMASPSLPSSATAVATVGQPGSPELQESPASSTIGATPEASSAGEPTPTANAISGSDGTSGATDLPAASASPAASPAGTGAVKVDSCDVVDAPPFSGGDENQQVTEELNFRVGPGADCDPAFDAPLEVGTDVVVLSDPVVRSDLDDGTEWIQVEVDGETGWVAAEFVEPAP